MKRSIEYLKLILILCQYIASDVNAHVRVMSHNHFLMRNKDSPNPLQENPMKLQPNW